MDITQTLTTGAGAWSPLLWLAALVIAALVINEILGLWQKRRAFVGL